MASNKLDKKRQKVLTLQKDRRKLVGFMLRDCQLVEGSYRESLLRCGRTGCHCEKEGGHLVGRISRWEGGKLKNKVVRVADRDRIREMIATYKDHKKAMNQLKKIDDQERILLKNVIHLKNINYD